MPSPAPPSPTALPIGELSRQSGVNIETIRYYERIKILPNPPRTANGRRIYGPAETRTLAFIRRSRELGFTLDEIRTLLSLSAEGRQGTCAEVSELAADHLAEVRAKITDLKAMERVLAEAVRRCDTDEAPGCPLIDALWRDASTAAGFAQRQRSPGKSDEEQFGGKNGSGEHQKQPILSGLSP